MTREFKQYSFCLKGWYYHRHGSEGVHKKLEIRNKHDSYLMTREFKQIFVYPIGWYHHRHGSEGVREQDRKPPFCRYEQDPHAPHRKSDPCCYQGGHMLRKLCFRQEPFRTIALGFYPLYQTIPNLNFFYIASFCRQIRTGLFYIASF